MKTISRYIMTLALLLTAVTGAWAQSSPNVVEFEVPADWEEEYSTVTADDLPGFYTSTYDEAKAWTDAPKTGAAILIYAFDGYEVCYVSFENGKTNDVKENLPKFTVFRSKSDMKVYYTAEPTEWSLPPDETGKTWTLAKMPASDVELQVEYYAESNLFLGKEALADAANIAVKNGETTVDFDDKGKSITTVTEGNTVTATYTGTKKLLGMKVEKKVAPSLNITSPEVGQVIGSDGKNYTYGSLPTGVTAVAKICYVSGSNGLALALTDEEGTMNWSTAQTTCAAHTPAFTGGTWKLASKDEWDNMISTAGSFTDLREGFVDWGATDMQSACYWSSSEDDSDNAWGYGFDFGFWSSVSKGFGYYVRACLAF